MQIDIKTNKLTLRRIIKFGFYSLTFALILLANGKIYSQQVQKKITKQSALEIFSKGEFESALLQFTELSNQFTRDPVYKYYMGACLVNLEREPIKAAELLNNAIQGSIVVKTVPSDSWFYLGRAQQMTGEFNKAIDSFNTFTEQAGRKTAKSLGVPDFIKQCSEKKGKITISAPVQEIQINKTEQEIPAKTIVPIEIETIEKSEDKIVNSIEALPTVMDDKLNSALNLQFKADSVTIIADGLRKELNNLTWDKRIELQKRISELDSLAAVYQGEADIQYNTANGTIPDTKSMTENKLEVKTLTNEQKDTLLTESNVEKSEPGQKDVTVTEVRSELKPQSNTFFLFEINKQKSAIVKEIPVNERFPDGLIYLIQLAVFRNPVSIEYFKGLGPVYGLRTEGSDKTYYYVGLFRRLDDAARALNDVKTTGFKDAFIIAMTDNKIVSADRAKILEKEWGQRPLFGNVNEYTVKASENKKDTIPSSLLFRVEVMKSQKEVKADILENLKKMAADRGFDILIDEKGMHIYLIGKFLNFATASEYTDLLIRNGYKEAKVVAYIGKIEIPIDMAMKLFEK